MIEINCLEKVEHHVNLDILNGTLLNMKNLLKRFSAVLPMLLMGWTVASCSSPVPQTQLKPSSAQEKPVNADEQVKTLFENQRIKGNSPVKIDSGTNSINLFATHSYQKLSLQEGNILLSPHSISTTFALIYGAARGNTQRQISDIFYINSKVLAEVLSFWKQLIQKEESIPPYQFSLANMIWIQKNIGIQLDFIYSLIDTIGSLKLLLQQQDFVHETETARKNINQFVSRQTKGRIREILASGSISDQTKLVLISAIYFKGAWQFPFDEGQTKKSTFHVSDKQLIEVPMMTQKYTVDYFEDDLVQLIELPYKGRTDERQELSMVILLPKDSHRLKDVEKNINRWLSPKQLSKQLVSIYLPKFTLESDVKLIDMLKEMGLTDIFNPQLSDLSGISKGLFISYASHKAFIEVNEKGTEAAASTAISVTSRGISPTPQHEFKANHPFIFWIKDNVYGTVLFVGRVANPG